MKRLYEHQTLCCNLFFNTRRVLICFSNSSMTFDWCKKYKVDSDEIEHFKLGVVLGR